MHITSSVFINDDESGLHKDYAGWLEELAPHEPLRAIATTAPARTTATPTSSARSWAARSSSPSRGQLDFGPWEQIFYGEFDGRRRSGSW